MLPLERISHDGIVYVAYVIMFAAVLIPVIFVWCLEVTDLWVVYLQYILGGIAVTVLPFTRCPNRTV